MEKNCPTYDLLMISPNNRRCERYGVSVNNVNEESLKIGLKIYGGKSKFMTNCHITDNKEIDAKEIKKVANYRYLGQTIAKKNRTRQEVSIRIKAGWSGLGFTEKSVWTGTFP